MVAIQLCLAFLALSGLEVSKPLTPQIPLSTFSSIALRGGGNAILRHGATEQITFIKGSPNYTSFAIREKVLNIMKCKGHCPRGYELQIEITAPTITSISVTDGGTIESRDRFPVGPEISVTVSQGGTIDIRSFDVTRVVASVNEGGRIFTRPRALMSASVVNGGDITYWGEGHVNSSVQGGGVVSKGDPAEANKPLSELVPTGSTLAPIVPLSPIQSLPNPKS